MKDTGTQIRRQQDKEAGEAAARQELADCRDRLDVIDGQITELLGRRFDVVQEVGRIKQEQGWPILDRRREEEKLAAVSRQAGGYGTQAQELYRLLMAQSKELEGSDTQLRAVGLLFDFSADTLIGEVIALLSEAEQKAERLHRIWAELIRQAVTEGWQGNLWQAYLTRAVITAQQPLAGILERREKLTEIQWAVLQREMRFILELWQVDWQRLASSCRVELPLDWQSCEQNTVHVKRPECVLQAALTAAATEPKQAEQLFLEALTAYYRHYGYGEFSLFGGFRLQEEEGGVWLWPTAAWQWGRLEDIIGYERQKQKLVQNTELFLNGFQANHCLLYGAAGTGKSSCVRALLSHYFDRGLRILEVRRDQIHHLPQVFEQLRGRVHRWIILLDDLSFEEFEVDYKQLKVMMEGGLSGTPDNVLFYATGNRRHITQTEGGTRLGAPTSDQKQERLSLAARFGETIFFDSPDRAQFNEIVLGLAKRYGLDLEREDLIARANAWELMYHGRSGRSAIQFIRSLQTQEGGAEQGVKSENMTEKDLYL